MNELQTTSGSNLQVMWKIATQFSQASLVPDAFRGKPADVFLVMGWCDSVGLDYMSGLQGTYVLHGKVGIDATLFISLANSRGPFDGPIMYETTGKGESMAVTAYGMIGDTRHEKTVSMAIAKAEGWTKNSKYKTIPEQMLSYRAATFLIRLYCPEVASSTQTHEEVQDIEASKPRHTKAEVLPQEGVAAELNAQLEAIPTRAEATAQAKELAPEPETVKAPRPKPKSEDDDADRQRWADEGMFDK